MLELQNMFDKYLKIHGKRRMTTNKQDHI